MRHRRSGVSFLGGFQPSVNFPSYVFVSAPIFWHILAYMWVCFQPISRGHIGVCSNVATFIFTSAYPLLHESISYAFHR